MMFTSRAFPLLLMITVIVLSGCDALPGSGPTGQLVVNSAQATLSNPDNGTGYDYALVEVRRDLLPLISVDRPTAGSSFGVASNAPPELRLGVGDVLQITIFESQAGGLFIPREAGARPGNFVVLPRQEIGRSGTILVPYAGEITAAGQTIEVLEQNIRTRLEASAIEPQVSIEIVERNFARASIVGSVGEPGSITLRANGMRILDLIAEAGGIVTPQYSTSVSLVRGGVVATVPYSRLTEVPAENIFVAPGDTVNVSSTPRKYYVFGASGLIGEFDFNDSQIDLRTALGFAAGLSDGRADPSDIFIYRNEDRNSLVQMGIEEETLPVDADVPTVYRVDFRLPDSFFLASEFNVRDGDVIYIANADQVNISRILDFAQSVTGGVITIEQNVREIAE